MIMIVYDKRYQLPGFVSTLSRGADSPSSRSGDVVRCDGGAGRGPPLRPPQPLPQVTRQRLRRAALGPRKASWRWAAGAGLRVEGQAWESTRQPAQARPPSPPPARPRLSRTRARVLASATHASHAATSKVKRQGLGPTSSPCLPVQFERKGHSKARLQPAH